MAWSVDALRCLMPWAKTGDRVTPESVGYVREKGWSPTYSTPLVSGGKGPEREVINQRLYELDEAVGELIRRGVGEWSPSVDYEKGSIVNFDDGGANGAQLFRGVVATGPNTAVGSQQPRDDKLKQYWQHISALAEELRQGLTFADTARDFTFVNKVHEYTHLYIMTDTDPVDYIKTITNTTPRPSIDPLNDAWVSTIVLTNTINRELQPHKTGFFAGLDQYRLAVRDSSARLSAGTATQKDVDADEYTLRVWFYPFDNAKVRTTENIRIFAA